MSKSRKFNLPDVVHHRALTEGEEGRAWLGELDEVVASLESDWKLTVGRTLAGGSAAFVAQARTESGQAVVLKVGTPGSDVGRREALILSAAQGRGYVQLLRYDARRRALLLERLGSNLEQLNLSVQTQIELLCAALLESWMPVSPELETSEFETGRTKALGLTAFIEETWWTTGKPCSPLVIQQARRYALQRAYAFDVSTAVLAHGDPHSANLLAVPGTSPRRFKFVDPDGLHIERAYDLGVMLRGWNAELLRGDAAELAWQRTHLASQLTGIEAEAIWQWSFIERVSTGLALRTMGRQALSREFLGASERIIVSDRGR